MNKQDMFLPVEDVPPVQLADPNASPALPPGEVQVVSYKSESIDLNAHAASNALLVLGEKYHQAWYVFVDGKQAMVTAMLRPRCFLLNWPKVEKGQLPFFLS
ncbi:MAG: hypothetical protein WC156_11005 [Pedobacter sp.]